MQCCPSTIIDSMFAVNRDYAFGDIGNLPSAIERRQQLLSGLYSASGPFAPIPLIRSTCGRSAAPPIPAIKLSPNDCRSCQQRTRAVPQKMCAVCGYSITSSTSASSDGGTARPCAFTVLTLMIARIWSLYAEPLGQYRQGGLKFQLGERFAASLA
jgi:hypothetical protein